MFFSYKKYQSTKNGTIVVSRFFSEAPSIFVNKCLQSGTYIIDMWRNAFSFLPRTLIPHKILMLGLGGGNAIALLREKYPSSIITIIEWDEVMIQIAEDLQVYTPDENIHLLHRDAFAALPELTELFDLIIIDLFKGEVPPIQLTNSETLLACKKILCADGYLLVNFYRHEDYKSSFKEFFSEVTTWKFKANMLTLYKKT